MSLALRPRLAVLLLSRCILVINADSRAFLTILALFLSFFSFLFVRLLRMETLNEFSYTLLILLLLSEFGMDEYGILFNMRGARHASLLL